MTLMTLTLDTDCFRMNKVPYIKFICRTVSHFFLLLLLIVTGRNSPGVGGVISVSAVSACIPIDKIQDRSTFVPQWYEWMLLSKFPSQY